MFLGVLWPGGRLDSPALLCTTACPWHGRSSQLRSDHLFFQCGIFLVSCIKCVHQANWCCNFETGSLISEHFVFPNWVGTRPTTKPDRDQVERLKARCCVHLLIQIWHVLRSIMHSRGWFDIALGRWYINIMNTQSWTSISSTSRQTYTDISISLCPRQAFYITRSWRRKKIAGPKGS